MTEFSQPYNWCDGRCRRCPIAASCPLSRHILELDRRMELAGAAPAQPSGERLGEVAAALRDLRQVPGHQPGELSIAGERLGSAAFDYASEAYTLARACASRLPGKSIADILESAFLVAIKAARIAGYLGDDGRLSCEAGHIDGAPNALLIDRLLYDNALRVERIAAVAPDAVAAMRDAAATLDRLMQPVLESIRDEVRTELDCRILERKAPSPFLCPV